MKKIMSTALCICLLLTTVFAMPGVAFADGSYNVGVDVTFGQTEARKMLDMINSFRASDDAWYWDSDDTSKVNLQGKLDPLKYDYELEKVAMQRAVEVALSFSHTRPNGGDCFSAFPDLLESRGENIAAGQTSAQKAYTSWREDEYKYSGQGHRRNMLDGQAVAIGIGHVVYKGVDYWTQEFSFNNPGTTSTTANDSEERVGVEIAASNCTISALTCEVTDMTMKVGNAESAPEVAAICDVLDHWTYNSDTTCTVYPEVTWTSSDETVAKIEDGSILALKKGTAKLTAKFGNQSASFTVTVTDGSDTGEPDKVSVTLDAKTLTVKAGETAQLTASVEPSDYSGTVSWVSDNKSVATVDSSGLVTALAEGTANIKASAGSASASCKVTVEKKEVTVSVSLDKTELTIKKSETAKLNATITPSDYSRTVTWSSDNESVATVDEYGYVTPVSKGTANISVTAGSAKASCKVTVTEENTEVTVTLDRSTLTVNKGETAQLNITVTPSGYSGGVSWHVENANVAEIDHNGVVTAKEIGIAYITITAGSSSATCVVTVVESGGDVTVSLDKKTLTVKEGETAQLNATVNPPDGTGTISWSSDNEDVATVSDTGLITAKAEGTAKITAAIGQSAAACEVTVKHEEDSDVTVTFEKTEITIMEGESVTLTPTFTPSDYPGKRCWLVENSSVVSYEGNGVIKAVGVGTTNVTVTAGSSSATCKVTVVKKPDVNKVSLDKTELTLTTEETGKLNVTIDPSDYSGTVIWDSDNDGVAQVDEAGNITPVSKGTANISVTAGSESATCKVTVIEKEKDVAVSLDKTELKLFTGDTAQLAASLDPSDYSGEVTWSSDNKSAATVDSSGLVTAVAAGTANITVKVGSSSAACKVTVEKKPVVTIDLGFDFSIDVGNSCVIKATVTPEEYADELVWSSDKENIVSVDGSGMVIAKAEGKVKITASAGDGSASVEVTVSGGTPATSVSIDKKSLTLQAGQTEYLLAKAEPSDYTGIIVWQSSDEGVATVDSAGGVTGVAAGTAKIKAVAGALSAECTVTVKDKEDVTLKIDPAELSIDAGNTAKIGLKVTPADYSGEIVWSSNNNSVATVDSTGLVTAKAEGTAKITASTDGVTAICTVTVKKAAAPRSGKCGDDLTWELDDDGVLTISGTGEMYDMTSTDKNPWYGYKNEIVKVVIEDGAVYIGENAFSDFDSITEVSIPSSVEEIGESAFKDCDGLKVVSIRGGDIESHAFESCDALEQVVLGDNITFIEDSAFAFCGSLTEVQIPGSVEEIGDHAFAGTGIKKLSFSKDGTTVIDDYAFSECTELTTVQIPKTMEIIGDNAFDKCGKLKTVEYGDTKENWDKIEIGNKNEPLLNAEIKFTGSSEPDHMPGDINGDGQVNNKDIIRLMKYLSGDDVTVVSGALDVNGDGSVNNKDLIRLMKYIAGADVELH